MAYCHLIFLFVSFLSCRTLGFSLSCLSPIVFEMGPLEIIECVGPGVARASLVLVCETRCEPGNTEGWSSLVVTEISKALIQAQYQSLLTREEKKRCVLTVSSLLEGTFVRCKFLHMRQEKHLLTFQYWAVYNPHPLYAVNRPFFLIAEIKMVFDAILQFPTGFIRSQKRSLGFFQRKCT